MHGVDAWRFSSFGSLLSLLEIRSTLLGSQQEKERTLVEALQRHSQLVLCGSCGRQFIAAVSYGTVQLCYPKHWTCGGQTASLAGLCGEAGLPNWELLLSIHSICCEYGIALSSLVTGGRRGSRGSKQRRVNREIMLRAAIWTV